MKFLPEQKNKRLWSGGLLLISAAGIVYFNFFSGPRAGNRLPAGEVFPPAYSGAALPSDGALPAKPQAKKSTGGLLPYGSGIETAILEQEKFKTLKAAAPVSVSEEELGRDDLFR